MKHTSMIPPNLQFFADGGEGGAVAENQPVTPTDGAETQNASASQPTDGSTGKAPAGMAELADTLLKVIDERTKRAEKAVTRSMAEQHGVSEAELAQIVERYKAEKAKELPPEAQRQIKEATERANALMIAAEVRTIGAEMGLIDPETALLLMDKSKTKVDPSGKVEGVKDALSALKEAKPYLFGREQKPAAWSWKHGDGKVSMPSRAAQIAAEYHANLYGAPQGSQNKGV